MMLYEIPKGSSIEIKTNRCPNGEIFIFHNTDGMYSYCTAEDGKVLHLSVITPMVHRNGELGDYYEVDLDLSNPTIKE